MNTELLLLQAHARFANPTGVPADFRLSTIGWSAAGPLVSELPTGIVRNLVLLFGQYNSLNLQVETFGTVLRDREAMAAGSQERHNADTMLNSIIDVFNTGIDATIERGQELIPELADLALIKETEAQKREVIDYASKAAQLIADRQQRIAAFRKRFGPGK